MKYEVLKRSHLKRNIVIAVLVVSLISSLILNFTQAKYRTTESMPLLNGTINYTLADLNIVAMYLDGSEIDTLPDGNYELTEESYCTNEENVKDEAITLSYDSSTKGLSVRPLTTKGTKCYLYFDEKASAGNTILAASKPQGQTTDWTGKESYYYTWKPNNWVQFAGFWWRIIRINGDGTIRMIYQGVADSPTPDDGNISGEETQIGTSAFNDEYENNMYVGFKYGSDSSDYNTTHANINNSTILGPDDSDDTATLNGWYRANLLEYAEYIDGNAGFCGDRTPSTSESSSNGSGGTGITTTYYGAYIRLYGKGTSNSNPSLQCDSQDVYTTTDSSSGNKSLQYPIGLVTADEAALTGITYNNRDTRSYLYTGQTYWTMSPFYFYSSLKRAHVFSVNPGGFLNYDGVYDAYGVRPVINLKSTVALEGDGSVNTPFKIVGT